MPLPQEYFAVRMRALALAQACTLLLALSLATRSATSFMRLSQTTLRTCTAWLLAVHGQQRGFTLGLMFAASALVLGALIYVGSALRWRRMP